MRADRLISMIMILQTRTRVTAKELAEELEVSERTVYRDVIALSSAGVPVYTEKGPGGGIRLVEDYQTTLTGLSPEEIQALFMLNVPESMSIIGIGEEYQNAMLKLAASLPRSLQQVEVDVRQRILIDTEYQRGEEKAPSSFFTQIYRAVWEDKAVHIRVRYSFGLEIGYEFHPYSLVASGGLWFVIGKKENNFIWVNLERIEELKLLEESFVRDPSFDLRQYWRKWKTYMKSDPFPFETTFLVDEKLTARILRSSDLKVIDLEQVGLQRAGWQKMVLGFSYFNKARDWVLRFGGAVEVLAPPALRLSVIDFAKRTLEVYEQM